MIHFKKYNELHDANMNVFQKYERKMFDYMKNDLNIDVENFSLYFTENTKYNFDFIIGSYLYNFVDDFISVDNYEDFEDWIEYDRDGLEPDEYFNISMSNKLSVVLLKDNTAKLREKAKEVVDECIAEIKVLLDGNYP